MYSGEIESFYGNGSIEHPLLAEEQIPLMKHQTSVQCENGKGFILLNADFTIGQFSKEAQCLIDKVSNKRLSQGTPVFEYFKLNLFPGFKSHLDSCFQGEQKTFDFCFPSLEPSKKLLAHCTPLYSDTGNVDQLLLNLVCESSEVNDHDQVAENGAILESIINNTVDSIFSVDRDYKITYANNTFIRKTLQLTCLKKKQGDYYLDWENRKPLASSLKAHFEKAFNGSQFKVGFEYIFNNEIHYREASFNPIIKGNDIVGASCFVKDITQSKLNAERLARSEVRFRALIENSHDGVALAGRDGKLKYLTPSVERILGFSTVELKGTNPDLLVHPEDKDLINILLSGLYPRFGETEQAVYRLKNKHGNWRWVRSNITNMLHEPTIEAIVYNYEDITDRKQAGEDIKNVNKQIREALERQTSILNSIDAHIALLNGDGVIVEVNKAWKKFADENGFCHENYGIGLNYIQVSEKDINNERSGGLEMAKGIRDVLAGGTDIFTMEYTCHSPTEKRWFRAIVNPLYSDHRNGVVVYHLDVTERKLAEFKIQFDKSNLDGLINSTHNLMWSIDREMKLITANHAYKHMVKTIFNIEVKSGDNVMLENSPKALFELWERRYQRALTGEFFETEDYISEPDEVWTETSFNPIMENDLVIGVACYARDITERKRWEQQIQQNERMMADAESIAHFGSWELDLISLQDINQNKLRWSDEVFRIFGYEPGGCEVCVKNLFKAIHPEDSALVIATVKKALEQQSNYSLDHRILKPDGTIHWVHEEAKILIDEKTGKPAKMVGTILNITERKQAEEKIFQTERLLSEAQSLTKTGNWNFDVEKNELFWSAGMKGIFGVDSGFKASLEAFSDLLHPEDRDFVAATLLGIFEKDEALEIEFRIIRQDRQVRIINSQTWIDKDAKGNPLRIFGIFQDITKVKMAEEAKQKSEAHLRTIFDNTDNAYVLLDTNFNILTFNGIANDWARITVGKNLKKDTSLISFLSSDKQERATNILNSVIAGETIITEPAYPAPDGSLRWFLSRQSPVCNNKGNVLGIFISAKDITDRKNHELEREKMTEDIIQRNKDLEQFAYIVFHNLRAPVANIMGFSDILLQSDVGEDERKELIQGLTFSVNKLDDVILDLNTILQVKREINERKEIVDFLQVVNNIVLSIENLIQKEQVEIRTDFSAVAEMLTLKSYIYSIFYNLISNSIKYRQIGVPLVLDIKSQTTKDKMILVFKDNGLGIDIEGKNSQVFGLYKRFHPHTAEGKGIGLFMVKTQVEALGGKIHLNSEVNKGTEFIIEFELLK